MLGDTMAKVHQKIQQQTIIISRIADESFLVRVPSVNIVDTDLDKLTSVRERIPIQQHRDNSSFHSEV